MSSKNTDLDKITQTVQYYFDGMYHSDTETLKKAFDPDAFLDGYFEGQSVHLPFNAWLKQIESRPAPSKNGEAYEMKIVAIGGGELKDLETLSIVVPVLKEGSLESGWWAKALKLPLEQACEVNA